MCFTQYLKYSPLLPVLFCLVITAGCGGDSRRQEIHVTTPHSLFQAE